MDHSHAILHLMTILLVMGFAICTCFSSNITNFGCISGERNALLKLKASFEDPANRLSSWHTNSTDCCMWKGVVCDSNRVVSLHLRNTHWRYEYSRHRGDYYFRDQSYSLRSNHLDSSLLELKYLSYLDLSRNDFQLSPIPAFLGSMKQLQHLNLSNANFNGGVPHNLGNLSSLLVLDLNNKYGYGRLMVDDLMWVSNLPSIEHLDMTRVDLSRAKHLSEVLFHMLPSILVLRLSHTQLNNTRLPHSCVNSSLLANIHHLDLSSNSFYGKFPCFLHNMTSLRDLDLSNNNYNSSSPHALLRLRNLVHLDLSGNELHHKTDWISELLLDKCNLKSLSLYHNKFYGELSGRLFRNLSMGYCWTHKLETLDLSGNQFDGHLPQEISELKQLNSLDLSVNAFTGPIPSSIEKLRALRYLFLSDNHLSGELPIFLGQMPNLVKIDILNNSFNGTVSELHFAKLSKLEELRANSINLSVVFDRVPPFQLKVLYLSSCIVGDGQFPQWLRTQKALKTLRLWNCSISGSLPKWLHYLNLTSINLSDNMINSSLPKLPTNLIDLSLSDNLMDGSIPDSLCQLKAMRYLDLSRNQFSGNIPNCWANLQKLNYLRLSSNNLSGVIPSSLGECRLLGCLQMNNNSLTGKLPRTLRNCTYLGLLDVGDNQLTGDLPDWIGSIGLQGDLPDWMGSIGLQGDLADWFGLQVLRLRNNEFYGEIPSTFCQQDALQVLDLANNKLTGNIPHCFGNISGMRNGYDKDYYYVYWTGVVLTQVLKGNKLDYTKTSPFVVNLDLSNNSLVGEIPPQLTNLSALVGLNLSHNHLGGKIPDKIGDMKNLESVDLSSNKLCGTIPESLSRLNFLTSLNLSYNNLSGRIPTGHQLQTLENQISIYHGNPGLCGDPLPKRCPGDEASNSPSVDENEGAEDEDDRNEKIIFYGIIASGFTTGFWGIIGILVVKRSWRLAFFQFAQDMMHKMLRV